MKDTPDNDANSQENAKANSAEAKSDVSSDAPTEKMEAAAQTEATVEQEPVASSATPNQASGNSFSRKLESPSIWKRTAIGLGVLLAFVCGIFASKAFDDDHHEPDLASFSQPGPEGGPGGGPGMGAPGMGGPGSSEHFDGPREHGEFDDHDRFDDHGEFDDHDHSDDHGEFEDHDRFDDHGEFEDHGRERGDAGHHRFEHRNESESRNGAGENAR